MKKIVTFFLLTVCVLVHAQNRNMLPGADFEYASLTDYWANLFTNGEATIIDTDGIRGKSLKITDTQTAGYTNYENRIICQKPFAASNGEVYKVTFKAKAEGTGGDATVFPELNMSWGGTTFQNIFSAGNSIAIPADGTTVSYSLTSVPVGTQTLTDPLLQTDFMDFLMYFDVPPGTELIIDDVELVRVGEEWTASVNMNGDFALSGSGENDGYAINERIMEFLFYSRDVTGSLALGNSAGKNTAVVTIGANVDDVNIFTGFTYFHDANRTAGKKYRVRFDAEASSGITSFTPSVAGTNAWVGMPGAFTAVDLGNVVANTAGGVQTYTSDIWTVTSLPTGALWLYIDVRIFGEGTVTFHNLYLEEVIDPNSLSIVMPEKVLVASSEPVAIWANPTNADNAVELNVDNSALGEVTKISDGTWSYKALAEGPVKITATGKADGKTTDFTVANVTDLSSGITEKSSDNMQAYYNDGYIRISGLEGNEIIEIFSLCGQLLVTLPARETVDAASLGDGLYILKITKAGVSTIQKIMVR